MPRTKEVWEGKFTGTSSIPGDDLVSVALIVEEHQRRVTMDLNRGEAEHLVLNLNNWLQTGSILGTKSRIGARRR